MIPICVSVYGKNKNGCFLLTLPIIWLLNIKHTFSISIIHSKLNTITLPLRNCTTVVFLCMKIDIYLYIFKINILEYSLLPHRNYIIENFSNMQQESEIRTCESQTLTIFRLGITCYCAVETAKRQVICDGIGIEYFFTQHPVW